MFFLLGHRVRLLRRPDAGRSPCLLSGCWENPMQKSQRARGRSGAGASDVLAAPRGTAPRIRCGSVLRAEGDDQIAKLPAHFLVADHVVGVSEAQGRFSVVSGGVTPA